MAPCQGNNGKSKENLYFQCFYKGREGQVHDNRTETSSQDIDATRDKISETSDKAE